MAASANKCVYTLSKVVIAIIEYVVVCFHLLNSRNYLGPFDVSVRWQGQLC